MVGKMHNVHKNAWNGSALDVRNKTVLISENVRSMRLHYSIIVVYLTEM